MEEAYHECAVGGVSLKRKDGRFSHEDLMVVPSALMVIAHELQPRGQKSSGVSVYHPLRRQRIRTHKEVGSVAKVYRFDDEKAHRELVRHLEGVSGIVNNRYSTSGRYDRDDPEEGTNEAQPFDIRHFNLGKRFCVGFNGTIINNNQLRRELTRLHNYSFGTEVDTETIAALMSLKLKELADFRGMNGEERFEGLFRHLHGKLDGAYNIVAQFGTGELAAYRDFHGFHPLVYGENNIFSAVASESIALNAIGIRDFEEVKPGELLVVKDGKVNKVKIIDADRKECEFEDVYFARGNSIHNGEYVRDKRVRLGKQLALSDPLRERISKEKEKWVVIPAPWTGVAAAEGYAEQAGLKWRLGLGKKTGARAFISGPLARQILFSRNYDSYPSCFEGLNVLLMDDSVVRGDTSRKLVEVVKKGGANEVHLRSTKPRIENPCFYGIDFATIGELFARKYKDDKSGAKAIGADSLFFQSKEGLLAALGAKKSDLCCACIDGEYSTPCGRRRFEDMIGRVKKS